MRILFLLVSVIATGLAAPIQDDEGKPRESTKAIMDLEEQLKQQAGEDKKFYPSQGGMLPPPAENDQDAENDEALDDITDKKDDASSTDGEEGDDIEVIEPQDTEVAQDLTDADKEGGQKEQLPPEPTEKELALEQELANQKGVGLPADSKQHQPMPQLDIATEDELNAIAENPHANYQQDYPQNYLSEPAYDPESVYDQWGEYKRGDPQAYDVDEEDDREVFLGNLVQALERHPELLELAEDEFMEQPEYENIARPYPNPVDQHDAIAAEILASQREHHHQNAIPAVPQFPYSPPDIGMDEGEEQLLKHSLEKPQDFEGESAPSVVAKKRGYKTPEEELEWLNSANAKKWSR